MKSKVCLVCGGSSGIGLETCRGLLELGATVVFTGTTAAKVEAVEKELGSGVRGFVLDLTDFAQIRDFAARLCAEYERLDVLVHNAGLVLPKRKVNSAGVELTFAVTYLGPFLLTQQLMKLFKGTRIINVCSDLHRKAKLDFDDLQCEKRYDFISVYSKAELAKMLWTWELARRLEPAKATVNCLHPGGVRTNLFRHFRGPMRWLLWLSDLLKMSPTKGARTSIYLASSPEVEGATGGYYLKCRKVKPATVVEDAELAARLWEVSEKLVGGAH